MRWPPLTDLPVPDVVELHGKDAWEALVQHFDVRPEDTVPAALDVLPTDDDEWMRRLKRAGLLPDVDITDPWEGAR